MIDNRFRLVPTEHNHIYHLQFRVDMPRDKHYKKSATSDIIAVCKQQYPELVFSETGLYQARFPDGQYASGTVETTYFAHTGFYYVKSILFSLPLGLDDIMAATCRFRHVVPPIKLNVTPDLLVDMTLEDFHEEVENMYAIVHKLNIRVRAVKWEWFGVCDNRPTYNVTPTNYDYI